jgi:hypothetical protein
MELLEAQKRQVENRNLISSIFVAILIGLAYQEVIAPVRASIRSSGITLGTAILFAIFFMTSMRFFIGNQLHLASEALMRMTAGVWFYDLMVIILQTTVMVFLGGVSSIESTRAARIDFVELLITLYSIDVVWIISQWFLGRYVSGWKRPFIPWAWCILNTVLVFSMILLVTEMKDIYSTSGLISLFIINTVAFTIDVILVDYYEVV